MLKLLGLFGSNSSFLFLSPFITSFLYLSLFVLSFFVGNTAYSDPEVNDQKKWIEDNFKKLEDDSVIESYDENEIIYNVGNGDKLKLSFHDVSNIENTIDVPTEENKEENTENNNQYDNELIKKAYLYYALGVKELKARKEVIDDEDTYRSKLTLGAMSFPITIDEITYVVKFFLVNNKVAGRVLVPKIIDGKKREVSYCFFTYDESIDPEFIKKENAAKDQFLARQKAQEKRNVVSVDIKYPQNYTIVNENDEILYPEFKNVEYSKYYPWYTVQGIKDWYTSIKAPPNVVLGGVCALWQAGVVGCFGVMDSYLNGGVGSFSEALTTGLSNAQTAMIVSASFGTVLGIWSGAYKNICYTGPYIARVIKSSISSIVYGYIITVNKSGWSALNPVLLSGILLNVHVIFNTVLGKTVLDEYYRIPRYKTLRGDYVDKGTIKIAGIDTKIEYSNMLFQGIYNFLVFPIKFADLSRMGFTLPGGKFVGLGKIIYYVSAPYVIRYNLKWFEKEYVNLVKIIEEEEKAEEGSLDENSKASVESKKLLKKLEEQYSKVEETWSIVHSLWMASSWMISLPLINMYRYMYLNSKLAELQKDYDLTKDPSTYVKIRRINSFISASEYVWQKTKGLFYNSFQFVNNKVLGILSVKKALEKKDSDIQSSSVESVMIGNEELTPVESQDARFNSEGVGVDNRDCSLLFSKKLSD